MERGSQVFRRFRREPGFDVYEAFIFSQSPPKLFGIVYTARFNLFAVIFWAVALALLVYFPWVRR